MRRDSHSSRTVRLLAETVFVLLALAGAAGWSLAALPSPHKWLAVALFGVLQGLWFDRLYTVAHEAVHRKLVPGRPLLNDLLGTVLMLPIVAPFTVFRKIHGFHHGANRRDAGSAALDHFPVPSGTSPAKRRRLHLLWLFYVFGAGFFLHTLATILIFLVVPGRRATRISPVFRAWPPRQRLRAWAEFAAGVALHLAVALGLGGEAWLALLGLPMLVFAWFWSMMLYIYHYRTSVGADVRHNVRSLPRQPFLSWLLLNFNEHATHHWDPSIPWYRLPAQRHRLPASHDDNENVAGIAAAIWQQRRGPTLWVRD